MSRNIMSASSSSSAYLMGSRSTDNHAEYDIWKLIQRRTPENAFCMESKYRMNAKIHRIKLTTVKRERRSMENVKADEEEEVTSSSSDVSQDWNDFDEDEEDLIELYATLTAKPTMSSAVGTIVTMCRQHVIDRPFSGIDSELIAEIATSGTRAQKLYLKRCADNHVPPSKIFLKALPTSEVDIGHQNIGVQGAELCALALTQTSTVRVLRMNDNGIGYRGAKYIAMLLKENRSITDLNLSDNNIGSKGAKYLTNVIMELDRIRRLELSNSGLKEDDACFVKQLLEETRNLHYLNISYNTFRETGGQLLGEALSYNDGLEELDLSWNHLRRKGAIGIAEGVMDNTSLKKLVLAWNGFALEGCIALQKTLMYNNTLEVLDLTSNRINRECLEQLSHGLAKNVTLHTLILKCNPLTTEGAQDILQFLADCQTSGIKLLDLGIQQVDLNCLALINEIHLQGRTLRVIYGHVIGQAKSKGPVLEKALMQENPSLILIEMGKLMGFRLVDLFSSLDKNGSRTLDRDEIRNGLKMANVPFSDQFIDVLIKKLDTNGDGEIDFSELLVAQQDHRDAVAKMMEAELSDGRIRVEDTALWQIRTRLMKLMSEKMSDYPTFRQMTEKIARQIQKTNDELEARREAITRERARRPRKVKSRPVSSTQREDMAGLKSPSPTGVDDLGESDEEIIELQVDTIEDADDGKETKDDIETDKARDRTKPKEKKVGKSLHKSPRQRKKSIQLPISSPDFLSYETKKISKQSSEASIFEEGDKPNKLDTDSKQ